MKININSEIRREVRVKYVFQGQCIEYLSELCILCLYTSNSYNAYKDTPATKRETKNIKLYDWCCHDDPEKH